MTALLALFVAEGLLLAVLSVPLILGKIGPNSWYGFRVRRTLDDPALWYPVNAFAAKTLLAVGLGTSLAAVVLYNVPGISLVVYASAMAVVVLAGLAVSIIASFIYLNKVSKSARPPDA